MNDNSTNKIVDKLNKYAKPGTCLTVYTKTMGELTGLFEEIDDIYLTLICDSRPEIISTNEIIRFSFKEANAPQHPAHLVKQQSNQPEATDNVSQVVDDNPSVFLPNETSEDAKPQIEEEKIKDEDRTREEHYLKMVFCGVPQLPVPQPIFDDRLKDNKEFWKLLDPWRNK